MAQPKVIEGRLWQMFTGNGATPTEAFAFLCIASSAQLNRQNDVEMFKESDCAAPGDLPKNVVVTSGQSWTASASGRCDAEKIKTLEAWLNDGAAHNVQFKIDKSGANGGGVYQGAVVVTSLQLGKSDHGSVTFSVEMQGAGAFPAFTAAA